MQAGNIAIGSQHLLGIEMDEWKEGLLRDCSSNNSRSGGCIEWGCSRISDNTLGCLVANAETKE